LVLIEGGGAFLQSMIARHSGAILVCRKASLQDADIRELCVDIEAGQKREVIGCGPSLRDWDRVLK